MPAAGGRFSLPARISCHRPHTQRDEREAENLPHIDGEGGLESLLHFLRVLDEEAEREDQRQAKAEVKPRAHLFGVPLVDEEDDEEEAKVGQGLIELPRMARCLVDVSENKSPRNIGHLAYYLGVHEVAKAYEGGRDAGADAHKVEHHPRGHLVSADVEPQSDEHSRHAAMAGKPRIARKLPVAAIVGEVDGQQHLHYVLPGGEEIARLVAEAVAQSCPDDNAKEYVKEQWIKLFDTVFVAFVEPFHEKIAQREACEPAQRVPSDGQRAYVQGHLGGIPIDEKRCHGGVGG